MKFTYYSLWPDSISFGEQYTDLDIEDLIGNCARQYPEIFQENSLLDSDLDLDTAPAWPHDDSKKWESAMASILFMLTGQVASKTELGGMIESVVRLRSYFKEGDLGETVIDKQFIFGFLPYLFGGFGFKDMNWSRGGINDFANLVTIVDQLFSGAPCRFSTYLCAHREYNEIDPDTLLKRVQMTKMRRALDLIGALATNSYAKSATLEIMQPAGSPAGIVSLFPSVVMRYLNDGNFRSLIDLLDDHMVQVSDGLSKKPIRGLSCRLVSIDAHVEKTVNAIQHLLGRNWKKLDEDTLRTKARSYHNHPSYRLAYKLALEEVRRLMPQFDSPQGVSSVTLAENVKNAPSERQDDVKRCIAHFSDSLTSAAKALYECLFYYEWGNDARKRQEIGIGLDRDHEPFQTVSWAYGYGDGVKNHHVPLLYARRNNTNKLFGNLHQTSFRQFWRW